MPPVYEVTTLRVNQLKTLRSQVEDLRNGRTARRDRAVLTFDLEAGVGSDPLPESLALHQPRIMRTLPWLPHAQTSRECLIGT